MNLGISLPATLPKDTRETFERLIAAAQAGWLKEHELDGTHSAPVTAAYNASMCLADAGGTLAVAGPDVKTWLYQVRGGRLWVQLLISGATVTGAPTLLRVQLPDGWRARDQATGTGVANDNGVYRPIAVTTDPDDRFMQAFLIPAAPWAASAKNTSFGWTWDFRVTR